MGQLLGIKDGSISASMRLERRDDVRVPKKNFKVTYYVLSDTTADTEEDIVGTTGIPSYFTAGAGLCWTVGHDSKQVCTVRHPNTGLAADLWEVTCNFDSDVDEDDDDDPENKAPTIRWTSETEEEVLEEDALIPGKTVQTDAEEPILITTPVVLPILEIKRYEAYPFNPNTILAYSHRTNSGAFWGAPAGSALFMPPEVDEETIEGVKYAVVTYRIKFKIKPGVAEPWKARVLHHGFKYRPNAGEKPKVYRDAEGNTATVNLVNGVGTKLPDGAQPQYLEFNRFQKANFNGLNLGPF